MRRFIAVMAAVVVTTGLARSADDAVTIKIKKSGPGAVNDETKMEKSANKITITVNGADQVRDEGGTSKFAYREEVLERPAGAARPTKLKRTYRTAEIMKADNNEDLGLAGKTVLIEKKGEKYEFTIDGKDVSGTAAQLLSKEFDREKNVTEEDFFPKEPVKVGGTWKIDTAKLAKDLAGEGMTVDAEKSTATGKLIKVYDKSGNKYGVVELRMDLVVTSLKGGDQEIALKAGSKLTVSIDADVCIDGTQDAGKSKMTMKGDLAGEANGVALKFDLNGVKESESTEVKK